MTPRGKKIYLKKGTWLYHICDLHSELQSFRDEVLKTLEAPDAIYQDFNALRSFQFSERMGKFIIVVYHCEGKVGKVITSYTAVHNIYKEFKGLMRIWP